MVQKEQILGLVRHGLTFLGGIFGIIFSLIRTPKLEGKFAKMPFVH